MREITLEMEVQGKMHQGSRTDLERLRREIERYHGGEAEVARMSGISKSTLNRKLNGKGEFDIVEIFRLSYTLDFSLQTTSEIFFAGYKLPGVA